jgi:hypothetical protein
MAVKRCFDNFIGTLIAPHLGTAVNGNSQQTSKRKQIDQPHVFTAQMGHKVQRMMECRAKQTACHTHDRTEDTPPYKNTGILSGVVQVRHPGHTVSPLSVLIIFHFNRPDKIWQGKTPSGISEGVIFLQR